MRPGIPSTNRPRVSRMHRLRSMAALSLLLAILFGHCPAYTAGPDIRIVNPAKPATAEPLFAADLEGSTPLPPDSRVEPKAVPTQTSSQPGWIRKIAAHWSTFRRTPLVSRIEKVGSWVGGIGRLIRSVPSAIFQGDSRPLIEAIGELLSGATQGAQPNDGGRVPLRGQPTEQIPPGEITPSGFNHENPTDSQPANH